MSKFFSTYKVIFYIINVLLIILYLYPGSLLGWIIYDNKSIQPQITPDFVISSNHFYVFMIISIIGFLTYDNSKINILLILYLISLSIILEIFHLLLELDLKINHPINNHVFPSYNQIIYVQEHQTHLDYVKLLSKELTLESIKNLLI